MEEKNWNSRRSCIYGTDGICSSSHPLASKAGVDILERGGNAVDAIIAMAAVLNVVEPCSTGLGGDAFLLFYNAKEKKVISINGSGKSPSDLTYGQAMDAISKNQHCSCTVTVPGACALWCDAIAKYGTLDMKTTLQAAINIASHGFPVSPIISTLWKSQESLLMNSSSNGMELLNKCGKAPEEGEVFKNPSLANVMKAIQEEGSVGFYGKASWISKRIVQVIKETGGCLSLDDLETHESLLDVPPLCVTYRKEYEVYEIGPNCQGIVALIALNLLEGFNLSDILSSKSKQGYADYLHLLIESLKLAFADARKYICDPVEYEKDNVGESILVKNLLSKEYAASRRKLISPEKANQNVVYGTPKTFNCDTVYLCCTDRHGNACSMVNSNYCGFGTGIVPQGCGFSLQNRGSNFHFENGHLNCYAPQKRPFNTIIPAMCLKNGELYASFGVMGAFMQPQGHVQVLLNMIELGMNPQEALDTPRFCLDVDHENDFGKLFIESGMNSEVVELLQKKGHNIHMLYGNERSKFGRGQIIKRNNVNGVDCGGCDPRCDGIALPAMNKHQHK